ncbi:MAG: L,D-transpeptidase [Pseudomonadota bacterium]
MYGKTTKRAGGKPWHWVAGAVLVAVLSTLTSPAFASVLIKVDKPSQTMTVSVDGEMRYRWPISTGATGYSTPTGSYTAFRLERMHYSVEWDGAGMPHSIFFTTRGHAIHGSNNPGMGTPRSRGCVRLSLQNAETLFNLVESRGVTSAKVVVAGADPAGNWAPTSAPTTAQTANGSRSARPAQFRERRGPFRGLFRRRPR